MTIPKGKPQINVRLSHDLHVAVKDAARTQGISLNQFVVNILSEAVSSVSVPLKAIGNVSNARYEISVPPEWFFISPILCGQEDIHHNVYLCSECSKLEPTTGGTARGCGKGLRLDD